MDKNFSLSESEKKILLEAARAVILSELDNSSPSLPKACGNLLEKCGAFVSLHIKKKLRGCIGYIRSDKSLLNTVIDAAKSSAFSDYRFRPLTASEFSQIEIEISVLSPFQVIDDISIIKPGLHGLYISGGGRSGLLLPQVAVEYNWNRNEFLSHTCMKAGLPADAWKTGNYKIEIFTAIVFSE